MTYAEPRFPTLLEAIEKVSAAQQRAFFLASGGQLAFLAAAAAAAIIPTDAAGNLGPVLTLLFFLAALMIQISGLARKAEHRWYEARAAAESIKTSSWEFAVGGEAFRREDDDAEQRYVQVLRRVLENVGRIDVGAVSSQNASVTEDMKALRQSDLAERTEAYLAARVEDQVRWYSDKAETNRRRSFQFGAMVVFVEGLAIVFGILRINDVMDTDYLGVLAACASGLVGWAQAKKYANLSAAYAVTSHEVSLVPATLRAAKSEESWAQAVHDAEAAFSREHTMWQARRQGPV